MPWEIYIFLIIVIIFILWRRQKKKGDSPQTHYSTKEELFETTNDSMQMYNQAAQFFNSQKYKRAKKLFDEVLKLEPLNVLAAYAMLECLSNLGVENVADQLPVQLEEQRDQMGLIFRQKNAANALKTMGFSVTFKNGKHTSEVYAEQNGEKYLIQWSEIFDDIGVNSYKYNHNNDKYERIQMYYPTDPEYAQLSQLGRNILVVSRQSHLEIFEIPV